MVSKVPRESVAPQEAQESKDHLEMEDNKVSQVHLAHKEMLDRKELWDLVDQTDHQVHQEILEPMDYL